MPTMAWLRVCALKPLVNVCNNQVLQVNNSGQDGTHCWSRMGTLTSVEQNFAKSQDGQQAVSFDDQVGGS